MSFTDSEDEDEEEGGEEGEEGADDEVLKARKDALLQQQKDLTKQLGELAARLGIAQVISLCNQTILLTLSSSCKRRL